MTKYRARTCPNCDYFLAFSVAQRPSGARLVPITNFCLNCNYKLPMHSVVHGARSSGRPTLRGTFRLLPGGRIASAPAPRRSSARVDTDGPMSAQPYSRHLRVIGQSLENFQPDAFILECGTDDYRVWMKSGASFDWGRSLQGGSKGRLQRIWRGKLLNRAGDREDELTEAVGRPAARLRYRVEDVERIEQEERTRRRPKNRASDGHALSQSLRTLGDLVERRGERLLGVAWQKSSISIVVETPQGRRGIDTFRPDNLYDLWVRMYLRRGHRATSDLPG